VMACVVVNRGAKLISAHYTVPIVPDVSEEGIQEWRNSRPFGLRIV